MVQLRNSGHSLIMDFLSERRLTHQTKIECSLSEIADLLSGVVRFSGIGPLLFITYINCPSRSKPARLVD